MIPAQLRPTAAGADRPRLFVPDGFDRRPELLDQEVVALADLDLRALRRQRARGIPRRSAAHWRALTRLVDPLDQALGTLHHDGEVLHRRAGSQAAAIVLANCCTLNRSWWGSGDAVARWLCFACQSGLDDSRAGNMETMRAH